MSTGVPSSPKEPQLSAKKKLGQNLNKLTARPNTQNSVDGERDGKHEHNGLLFMSTQKKASSGGLLAASKKGAYSDGLTNIPPNPVSSHSNIMTASTTTTHDALVSAVTGKMDRSVAPDAWGVAASVSMNNSVLTSAKTGEKVLNKAKRDAEKSKDSKTPDAPAESGIKWDDYGRRHESDMDDQKVQMSRLAQAARKRAEMEAKDEPRHTTLWSADRSKKQEESSPEATSTSPSPPVVMIQLKDYEDRSRGESSNSTAPRMLYDPKSGTMVEVKPLDEQRSKRKSSRRSAGNKPARKQILVKSTDAENPAGDTSGTSSDRKVSQQVPGSQNRPPSTGLPRTCGVLYKRDSKGQLVCADEGGGGDLGYGAHSVPGGRVQNPDAYKLYLKYESGRRSPHGSKTVGAAFGPDIQLSTGFDPVLNGHGLKHDIPEEEQVPIMELVKAGDKIELLADDDSPTLKPTAKEWAPSRTALAVAQWNNKSSKNVDEANKRLQDDNHEEEEDEDDEDGAHLGLGFDPRQHIMDDLIHSPNQTENDLVDLDALQLGPPTSLFGGSAPGHIFAFGISGTWGETPGALGQPDDMVADNWEAIAGRSSVPSGDFAATFLPPHGSDGWTGDIISEQHTKDTLSDD